MSKKSASWTKIGQIFLPDGSIDWMFSHASNPFAEIIDGTQIRVYFSSRDREKRSSIGFVEIDLEQPTRILKQSKLPILSAGTPGAFDDSGTTMGCLVTAEDDRRYLYYLGWNLAVTVPFRNSIGLAISNAESNQFAKYGNSALMDRDQEDPLTLSYPWVLREADCWRMWYGSHLSWNNGVHEMVHVIKYAESEDGISWRRNGAVNLPFLGSDEYAMSRPTVIREANLYRMWYTYRGSAYKIGYAESEDGINWERLDHKLGLQAGGSGWDAESVSYPCVFSLAGQLWMLYCGNGYGASGFGLARLE